MKNIRMSITEFVIVISTIIGLSLFMNHLSYSFYKDAMIRSGQKIEKDISFTKRIKKASDVRKNEQRLSKKKIEKDEFFDDFLLLTGAAVVVILLAAGSSL